mmetsp:Transcript_47271/g.143132  ORF Transcript_47271/g.143132 Transcript_47271/m.143132 type:complete len:290 (+) Transcript_47271:200-1069(+)
MEAAHDLLGPLDDSAHGPAEGGDVGHAGEALGGEARRPPGRQARDGIGAVPSQGTPRGQVRRGGGGSRARRSRRPDGRRHALSRNRGVLAQCRPRPSHRRGTLPLVPLAPDAHDGGAAGGDVGGCPRIGRDLHLEVHPLVVLADVLDPELQRGAARRPPIPRVPRVDVLLGGAHDPQYLLPQHARRRVVVVVQRQSEGDAAGPIPLRLVVTVQKGRLDGHALVPSALVLVPHGIPLVGRHGDLARDDRYGFGVPHADVGQHLAQVRRTLRRVVNGGRGRGGNRRQPYAV